MDVDTRRIQLITELGGKNTGWPRAGDGTDADAISEVRTTFFQSDQRFQESFGVF